ncbi:zinc ABC transporter permease [Candidatus Dependentiae bacterium Noda2021]|nr:zinc ABC transporter permease [Candidatus Dependentiae bacterium Noda2021]
MSDAISHAILPGIVLMFFIVGSLESPLLLVGAAIAGMLTVVLTEFLMNTKQLKKDAAIGLVFPFFFSVGVILISLYARTVHLDVDMVLLGELVFAPFNTIQIAGVSVGSYAFWSTSIIILINGIMTWLFFKEITLSIFDASFSMLAGFMPQLLYYGLMVTTSMTAVAAFNVVGSFVVVALMIAPAATASLLTHSVKNQIKVSLIIAVLAAINGYTVAALYDVSITGCIAVCNGVLFLLALLCAPHKGIIARVIGHRYAIKNAEQSILLWLYAKHSSSNSFSSAQKLGWTESHVQRVTKALIAQQLITHDGRLTAQGAEYLSQLH